MGLAALAVVKVGADNLVSAVSTGHGRVTHRVGRKFAQGSRANDRVDTRAK